MWSWASDRDARCRAQGRTAAVSPQTLGISWGHTGGPCPDWFSQSRRHASPTRSAWLGGHVSCPSPWQHLPLRGARPDPRVKLPPNLGTEGPHSQSCARSLSLAGRHRAVAVFARSRMLSSPASCSSPWGGGKPTCRTAHPPLLRASFHRPPAPTSPPPPNSCLLTRREEHGVASGLQGRALTSGLGLLAAGPRPHRAPSCCLCLVLRENGSQDGRQQEECRGTWPCSSRGCASRRSATVPDAARTRPTGSCAGRHLSTV